MTSDEMRQLAAHVEALAKLNGSVLPDAEALRLAGLLAELATRAPDGYALVMDTGHFVGAWKSREIAEKLQNRSSMSKGEVVRAFVFVDEPTTQDVDNG